MESLEGTPCKAAVERALQLAQQIATGEIHPIDGAQQIAWLGSADCYDFLGEVDVVMDMAGFWEFVSNWEVRQDDASARGELSEEIRQAAVLLTQYESRP